MTIIGVAFGIFLTTQHGGIMQVQGVSIRDREVCDMAAARVEEEIKRQRPPDSPTVKASCAPIAFERVD